MTARPTPRRISATRHMALYWMSSSQPFQNFVSRVNSRTKFFVPTKVSAPLNSTVCRLIQTSQKNG